MVPPWKRSILPSWIRAWDRINNELLHSEFCWLIEIQYRGKANIAVAAVWCTERTSFHKSPVLECVVRHGDGENNRSERGRWDYYRVNSIKNHSQWMHGSVPLGLCAVLIHPSCSLCRTVHCKPKEAHLIISTFMLWLTDSSAAAEVERNQTQHAQIRHRVVWHPQRHFSVSIWFEWERKNGL